MSRFTTAHGKNRLMLLGSPPDMVHSLPSHRTRSFARLVTQIRVALTIIIYIL